MRDAGRRLSALAQGSAAQTRLDYTGLLRRLKDLNSKAPKELKAYAECLDYYR